MDYINANNARSNTKPKPNTRNIVQGNVNLMQFINGELMLAYNQDHANIVARNSGHGLRMLGDSARENVWPWGVEGIKHYTGRVVATFQMRDM
jgi:hypothetical protein